MAKKSIGSSARGRQAKKNARSISDKRIDFTDIPELSDEQLNQMKRPGRPLLGQGKRHLIAIRVDPEVLTQLKKEAEEEGKGYQSLINEILDRHVRKNVA
jgi:uncharacterized protein (DUF4415 family)